MAKVLSIIIHPNPILRQKARELSLAEIKESATQTLAQDMAATMIKLDGAGLAGPQVGQVLRLIAINLPSQPLIMFNPKIIKPSWLKEWGEEGCLSIPKVFGLVKRSKNLRCRFIDAAGKQRLMVFKGLAARIIQHEVDHLDGVLFIDKAKKVNTNTTN